MLGQGILVLRIIHYLVGFSGKGCVNRFHAYAYCIMREKWTWLLMTWHICGDLGLGDSRSLRFGTKLSCKH